MKDKFSIKSTSNTSKIAVKNPVKKSKKPNGEFVLVLPDIRSSHNIGAIFRTADGAGVSEIVLTGHSPRPVDKFERVQPEIAKTALGAEKTIPWTYTEDASLVIKRLKKGGYIVVALEQTPKSISYKKIMKKIGENSKICLIVGNEVEGVSKKLLSLADYHIDIPMRGEKESLNVSVATGIILYELLQ